jgi:hypothetical protein
MAALGPVLQREGLLMKIATIHFTKALQYGPALLAAGFLVIAVPAMLDTCEPWWLYLQITPDDMPKEWN